MIAETTRAPRDAGRLLEVIKTQTDIAKLGLDLGGVMSLVAERAQALTGAIGSVVELAEGEHMVYRATSGIADPHLGLHLMREGSLSGLCVEAGQPLYCEDSDYDERVDREACQRIGLRSMIVVPLRHNDSVVGAFKVLARDPRAFDADDLQVLDLMSGLIAAAMFHATRAQSDELFHRATHDALTGLPNRSVFYERLRHGIALAERESRRIGILNLDMDGLKPINDQLGHRAGDAAIVEVASRLKHASRAADTVARVGGDEFGVILTRVADRDGAHGLAQRVAQQLHQPFAYEDAPVRLGASIGLAIYPDDGRDIGALLEKADQAMYAMKRQRKPDSVRE